MTVKELSEFTGKTERAIRNWVVKASELDINLKEKSSVSSPMNPADYNVDEVELILHKSSMGKDAVRILMENARRPFGSLELVSAPNQMDVLLGFMERQQHINQEFMKTVLSELKSFKQQPLQIEQIKQDYYSIKGYNSLKKLKLSFSECLNHGKKLSLLSKEKDIEIRKVSDERFGQVNSYSSEILDEYFSE